MTQEEDVSIEEVLATIRHVLWEKEVQKSASRNCIRDYAKEREGEIFQLTKDMLVDTGWNFDDTAKNILKKYAEVFAAEEAFDGEKDDRVTVKAGL